eukprot:TRINITY_DN6971_c0_g2_i3.p1 TRINITY_DN6971_c0_g2~~TRINITY_DN6971_c0_g2_i3.p1  ORF type:complete len:454 (+),score=54.56 TRINITY_DN6971_c0_g2_i3:64-1425(+)
MPRPLINSSRDLIMNKSSSDGINKRSSYVGLQNEEDRNSYLAAGKAVTYLAKMEFEGACGLEKGSVYGAAVAIPQVARSSGWPGSMIALTVRTYLFLAINIAMQIFLLTMIGEENHIMANFAGQPHLCNFAANMLECPDGPNCEGPGGTSFTPARLYDYDIWNTRVFVREALKGLFPDKVHEIERVADPGEYGMENWYCRVCCLFLFTMAVYSDLRSTGSLVVLLKSVPSKPEKWISYAEPAWDENKEHAKSLHGWTELDLVSFSVAGMPAVWKIINLVIIVLPKFVIWICLVSSGFHFLMETATITNLIVNSMALSFILNIDEMVFEAFSTVAVQHIMGSLDDHKLYDSGVEETETEDACLQRYYDNEQGSARCRACMRWIVPRRLIYALILMMVFYLRYFWTNCIRREDGSWVSEPLMEPEGVNYNFFGFLNPAFLNYVGDTPLWKMPEKD